MTSVLPGTPRSAPRGSAAEDAVVASLREALGSRGWTVIPRRLRPGAERADIDVLLVGTGGVLVVDVKDWNGDVQLRAGSLWQGDARRDEALHGVAQQSRAIADTLAEVGLPPLEVVPVLAFARGLAEAGQEGRVHVLPVRELVPFALRRGARLRPEQITQVAQRLRALVPAPRAPRRWALTRTAPVRPVIDDPAALFTVDEAEAEAFAAAARLPAKEWMVWLHPLQAGLVRDEPRGATRLRGAAGTGKTVVALHRVAWVAETRPGPVLLLTHSRTLPGVLRPLVAQLTPRAADRVRLTSLHREARRLLAERGHRVRTDLDAADLAFSRAWQHSDARRALETPSTPYAYWCDEVRRVIRGRGLVDFAEYAELARTGRGTQLGRAQRAMVWDLHRRYDTELRRLGVHDLADVVRLAVDAVDAVTASPPDPPYSLVAVDECQDLDLVSLRLVAALAGEPSRLLLVGDGRQALQPGGVRLLDAGIDVRGRSRTLPTCYRTTRQVLALARTFVEGDDELGEDGDLEVTGVRDGAEPLRVTGPTSRDLEVAVVQRVRDALAGGVPPGDVAVLLRRRVDVERWTGLLHRAGVPVAPLTRYAVGECGCVWVGTYQRSKGLEFGVVVLPAVERPQVTEGMDRAQAEETQRRRRELYVAMTRARDALLLGEVATAAAGASRPAAGPPAVEGGPPGCPTACAEPLR